MKAISSRSVKRYFLAMLYGALIGAFLAGIVVIRANADPETSAGEIICRYLSMSDSNAQMDMLSLDLIRKGFEPKLIVETYIYDIRQTCPQLMPRFVQWAESPVTTGGIA